MAKFTVTEDNLMNNFVVEYEIMKPYLHLSVI